MRFLTIKSALTFLVASAISNAFAANSCFENFYNVQNMYTTNNFDATIAHTDNMGINLYALTHLYINDTPYTTWKSLNGELDGYALKGLKGIDFNKDRQYVGAMVWHQSLIFDKLMHSKTILKNYECTLVGRTRISGRKVVVSKLSPVDDARYSFIIASDDETSLPVELSVIAPSNTLVTKFTVTAMHSVNAKNRAFPDDVFNSVKEKAKKDPAFAEMWPELTIPSYFTLCDYGVLNMGNEDVNYLTFTDGLVDFRVYKNSKTSVMIPSATDGTISVFRKKSQFFEYAVVGEIPLEMSKIILSKIVSNEE